MTTTPRLGATELALSQAIPETTVNAMVRHVEQFASRGIVKDKDLATPPGSAADGDAYIVAASPTGDWSGWATRIAYYSSGWISIIPIEGIRAYVQDENVDYEFNGTVWAAVATGGYMPGGTDVALADGGTGASLTDPNADRILFWDDSAGGVTWLAVGTGLSITGTTLAATGSGATIVVEDEGSVEGAAIDTLNFTGAGVSVTVTGSEAEIIIAGGGGGGGSAPTIRSSSKATASASSVVLTLPTGATAGDDMVIFTTAGNGVIPPSGWAIVDILTANGANSATLFKNLSSGDISTGSVTITYTGSFRIIAMAVCFTGATKGISFNKMHTSTNAIWTNQTTAKTWATQWLTTSDVLLIYVASRSNSANTSSLGTQLQNEQQSDGSASVYEYAVTTEGTQSTVLTIPTLGSFDPFFMMVAIRG